MLRSYESVSVMKNDDDVQLLFSMLNQSINQPSNQSRS